MLNRFYFSAKTTLVDNGVMNASDPFNFEDYEELIKRTNVLETKNFTKLCSLSNELDSVSVTNFNKFVDNIQRNSIK